LLFCRDFALHSQQVTYQEKRGNKSRIAGKSHSRRDAVVNVSIRTGSAGANYPLDKRRSQSEQIGGSTSASVQRILPNPSAHMTLPNVLPSRLSAMAANLAHDAARGFILDRRADSGHALPIRLRRFDSLPREELERPHAKVSRIVRCAGTRFTPVIGFAQRVDLFQSEKMCASLWPTSRRQ